MAESTIAGDYEAKCVTVPMVLSEGTITVTARAYSSRGLYETVATFASELRKGDPIAYAYGESIEYEDLHGLGAVTRIKASSAGYWFRGRIVSEPRWIAAPPTTAGTYPNFNSNVGNHYFRIADVELWGVTNVMAVKHTLAGAQDILLGKATGIAISAASSYSAHKVCIEDKAYGLNKSVMALTYRKNSTAGTAYTDLIACPSGVEIIVNS